jgi:hypothetical protein
MPKFPLMKITRKAPFNFVAAFHTIILHKGGDCRGRLVGVRKDIARK